MAMPEPLTVTLNDWSAAPPPALTAQRKGGALGFGLMSSANDLLVLTRLESVTLTLKLNVPLAVEIPERTPAEENPIPPGSEPELSVHEYGALPFVATSWFV